MLRKGCCINQTCGFTDRFSFLTGKVPPSAAAETARIMVEMRRRIFGAVVIWTLKSVHTAKLRAKRLLAIIGRACAQRTAGFALFVRVVQNIDMRIAFFIFARGIFGRHPILAVTLGVKAGHIDFGLTFDHHLRQVIASTTCRSDAEAETFSQPHIPQTRRRANQWVPIRRVADRAIVIVFQTHCLTGRDAVDHGHIFFFDPLQIEREEIRAETVRHSIFEAGRCAFFIGP